MDVIICDDFSSDVNKTKALISAHPGFKESNITTFTSSRALLDYVSEGKNIDIAFLDVDMPCLNGLELGTVLRERYEKIIIVFISAYPQYAISAFKCEAFSYLTKPLERDTEIDEVLCRVHEKYIKLFSYHHIKERTGPRKICIMDVLYIEYYKRHVVYHMKNERCETNENMEEVYDLFKDYGFYRAHKGYIVNLDKVMRFDKSSVVLINGQMLPISRRRKTDMMEAFAEYAEEHYR